MKIFEDGLLRDLAQFRLKNSGKRSPAYMIYSDIVMQAISESKPATLDALYRIKGVRRDFVAKHGNEVLKLIQKYR